jgi:hypothetical protein
MKTTKAMGARRRPLPDRWRLRIAQAETSSRRYEIRRRTGRRAPSDVEHNIRRNQYGIEQLGDPGRRADINLWLDRRLRPLFASRVLSMTEDVIVRWKTMMVDGRKRRHTFSPPDLFVGNRRAGKSGSDEQGYGRVCRGRRAPCSWASLLYWHGTTHQASRASDAR